MGKAIKFRYRRKVLLDHLHKLELVHSDVLGPVDRPSLGGSRYFITFIDDFFEIDNYLHYA